MEGYRIKSIGPMTELCGTPFSLFNRYDFNQPSTVSLVPVTCCSLCNAALISIKTSLLSEMVAFLWYDILEIKAEASKLPVLIRMALSRLYT